MKKVRFPGAGRTVFDRLQLNKLYTYTKSDNLPSIRVAKKKWKGRNI